MAANLHILGWSASQEANWLRRLFGKRSQAELSDLGGVALAMAVGSGGACCDGRGEWLR